MQQTLSDNTLIRSAWRALGRGEVSRAARRVERARDEGAPLADIARIEARMRLIEGDIDEAARLLDAVGREGEVPEAVLIDLAAIEAIRGNPAKARELAAQAGGGLDGSLALGPALVVSGVEAQAGDHRAAFATITSACRMLLERRQLPSPVPDQTGE